MTAPLGGREPSVADLEGGVEGCSEKLDCDALGEVEAEAAGFDSDAGASSFGALEPSWVGTVQYFWKMYARASSNWWRQGSAEESEA